MAGPIGASDVTISTVRLDRLLRYEPRDLTISVEAGMLYSDLSRILESHGQMIPLDPPFAHDATIGGVLSVNHSGPRRRMYGTARDMVIGMTFATLQGKLIQTGGMVVKNVAGLDMGKLMIGSFGTLAALATVNFRVYPIPPATRTFVRAFADIDEAIAARDISLASMLQPAAIDIHKTANGYKLLLQASGSPQVLERFSRGHSEFRTLEGAEEAKLWETIREMTPAFLAKNPEGAMVRVPCKLSEVGRVLERLPAPAIARSGSGVVYGHFADAGDGLGQGLIEFAPKSLREEHPLWQAPGTDFEMMKKLKLMFDPENLLNRGRLYGRI